MNNQTASIAAFGRLLMGALFAFSGLGKIMAPAMTQGYIAAVGAPSAVRRLLGCDPG